MYYGLLLLFSACCGQEFLLAEIFQFQFSGLIYCLCYTEHFVERIGSLGVIFLSVTVMHNFLSHFFFFKKKKVLLTGGLLQYRGSVCLLNLCPFFPPALSLQSASFLFWYSLFSLRSDAFPRLPCWLLHTSWSGLWLPSVFFFLKYLHT